jgi:hypothetical protein
VDTRKEFTAAIQNKGGDQATIIKGTVHCNNAVTGGRPTEKDRDNWTEEQQKQIAVIEHYSAKRVENLPDGAGHSQIMTAIHSGTDTATDAIQDKRENGNWFDHVFSTLGWILKYPESDERQLDSYASDSSSSSESKGKYLDGECYSAEELEAWHRMP